MTKSRSRFTAVSVVGAGVLMLAGLTACGASGPGSGSGAPAPSDVASSGSLTPGPGTSSEPGASLPPGKDKPGVDPTKGKSVTLTGTVEAGVEHGCLVLNAGGQVYTLFGGDRTVLVAGAEVEVTGHETPNVMSFCQQGTPFQVETARTL